MATDVPVKDLSEFIFYPLVGWPITAIVLVRFSFIND